MVYYPRATKRVAEALSRRPQVNHVSVSYHQDLESMRETYIHDSYFGKVMEKIQQGELVVSIHSRMAIFSQMTRFVLLMSGNEKRYPQVCHRMFLICQKVKYDRHKTP